MFWATTNPVTRIGLLHVQTSNPKWDQAIFDINGEALEHVPIIRVAVIPVAHHLVIDELLVKTHLQFL